jgi:hypothetical protein
VYIPADVTSCANGAAKVANDANVVSMATANIQFSFSFICCFLFLFWACSAPVERETSFATPEENSYGIN